MRPGTWWPDMCESRLAFFVCLLLAFLCSLFSVLFSFLVVVFLFVRLYDFLTFCLSYFLLTFFHSISASPSLSPLFAARPSFSIHSCSYWCSTYASRNRHQLAERVLLQHPHGRRRGRHYILFTGKKKCPTFFSGTSWPSASSCSISWRLVSCTMVPWTR